MSGERSPRPLSVIQSDIDVTKLGREACQAVVDTLLAQRYALLNAGWPTTHALCTALDENAARWAAYAEQMRRSLLDLMRERDPTPPRRITGEPPGWEGTRAVHERLYDPATADPTPPETL